MFWNARVARDAYSIRKTAGFAGVEVEVRLFGESHPDCVFLSFLKKALEGGRRPYGTPDELFVLPTPRFHPKKQRPFLGDPGEARG